MVRGSPRRDALEYGMLMVCTTGLTAGLGLMLYLRNSPQGLGQIDLNAPFDPKAALRELSDFRDQLISGNSISKSGVSVNKGPSKGAGASGNAEKK